MSEESKPAGDFEIEVDELTPDEADSVAGGDCSSSCGGPCSAPPDQQEGP